MKKLISFILTVFIAVNCYLYTYSSYNLPFRKPAFTVTSSDGSVNSLHDLIKTENAYRDTPVDVSADFRSKDITISGEIVIGKVEQEGDNIKIFSKYPYFDFGKTPFMARPDEDRYEDFKVNSRYIVIYFSSNNINLYNFPIGEKITFKAKFNRINARYIICTDGEVL